jgi:hypothetical protein
MSDAACAKALGAKAPTTGATSMSLASARREICEDKTAIGDVPWVVRQAALR